MYHVEGASWYSLSVDARSYCSELEKQVYHVKWYAPGYP